LDYFDDEKIAVSYYQRFKFETVAKFNSNRWTLTGREIEEIIERLALNANTASATMDVEGGTR
jgi:hypothetical protein